MPLVLNITVHSSLIEMRCKQMQHTVNEGCVNHKSQLVQCSIHSPFTTVNSFVYFHNVPYSHNSSIVFCLPVLERYTGNKICEKGSTKDPKRYHVVMMTERSKFRFVDIDCA